MHTSSQFSLSPNLKVTATKHQVSIEQIDKYRLFISIFMGLMVTFFLGCIIFVIATKSKDQQSFLVPFCLIIATVLLLVSARIYLGQRVLYIFLDTKTVTAQKGYPKGVQSHFNFQDISHWQLREHTPFAKNGYRTYYSTISIQLKSSKKKVVVFRLNGDINQENRLDSEKRRNNAYRKGREVCNRLQRITKIHWK